MKAFIAKITTNPKTGDISGQLEGASGNFYKGLTVTTGNNSTAALILVGTLAVGVLFIYPVSRKARLWAEHRKRQHEITERVHARITGRSSLEPVLPLESIMAEDMSVTPSIPISDDSLD